MLRSLAVQLQCITFVLYVITEKLHVKYYRDYFICLDTFWCEENNTGNKGNILHMKCRRRQQKCLNL
jgi:hypothetical protein